MFGNLPYTCQWYPQPGASWEKEKKGLGIATINENGASQQTVVRWVRKLALPAALVGTAAIMLAWTWGRWPDVVIDFGRELYTAWRLAEGDVLYRDVASFYGPLSPYFNSLCFYVFGLGTHVLMACNGVLLLALTLLIHRLFRHAWGNRAAAGASMTFVVLFAFNQYVGVGNYNYLSPYSHSLTHGLILGLASMASLKQFGSTGRSRWAVVAGLALGGSLLTQAEVFLPTLAGAVAWMAVRWWSERTPWRPALAQVLWLLLPMVCVWLMAWALLCLALPAGKAALYSLGNWPAIFAGQGTNQGFYRWVMGVDRFWPHMLRMLGWALGTVALFSGALVMGLSFRQRHLRPWQRLGLCLLAGGSTAIILWGVGHSLSLFDAFSSLPLLLLGLAGMQFYGLIRRQPDYCDKPALLRLALVVYAGMLLPKMWLNVHIYAYGFVLAMPATLVLVAYTIGWLPELAFAKGGRRGPVLSVALSFLLVIGLVHLENMADFVREKNVSVGGPGDSFYADDRGRAVVQALEFLHHKLQSGETLAVLPDGSMLNFLLRVPSSVPYVLFSPGELLLMGEPDMVLAFAARPPDILTLVHKDNREYGTQFFGRDYGRDLWAWIQEHYRSVAVFGAQPLKRQGYFGVQVLRRKRNPKALIIGSTKHWIL